MSEAARVQNARRPSLSGLCQVSLLPHPFHGPTESLQTSLGDSHMYQNGKLDSVEYVAIVGLIKRQKKKRTDSLAELPAHLLSFFPPSGNVCPSKHNMTLGRAPGTQAHVLE